jgi:hypothetical protein
VRKLFFLFSLPLFFSCSSSNTLLEAVTTKLDSYNRFLYITNIQLSSAMEYKKREPINRLTATTWDSIGHSFTIPIDNLLQFLQTAIKHSEESLEYAKVEELSNRTKDTLLLLDKEVNKEFAEQIKSITINGTLAKKTEYQKYLLLSLTNDYLILRNKIMAFCYAKCNNYSCGYEVLNALIHQNKSHFKNGEILEIKAGLGAYSTANPPKVFVHTKPIKVESGIAHYKLQLSNKPGKYTMPIRLEFRDENGVPFSKTETIEYFIEE